MGSVIIALNDENKISIAEDLALDDARGIVALIGSQTGLIIRPE